MKIKLNLSEFQCGYLHADGHLVVIYSKATRIDGKNIYQEYAHVHEEFMKPGHCHFKGRIVIHRYQAGMIRAIAECESITAKPMNIDQGSDNTKRLNIRVGYLQLDYSDGTNLNWILTDVISNPVTYQPDDRATFIENTCTGQWGTAPITKIFKKAEVKA